MLRCLPFVASLLFGALALLTPSFAAVGMPTHVQASLVAANASVQPGQPVTVALRLVHDLHWHTYWLNPGTGLPTSIEWKLPPGWKKTKRGKYELYCKTEAPMGTRLKSTTCYDEDNMRNYILALEENKADVDRIRATCSNVCVCGDPSAC